MTNREMDAFIAEKCFSRITLFAAKSDRFIATLDAVIPDMSSPNAYVESYCPRYTESMTDAWPVFEWLLENHPWKMRAIGRNDVWRELSFRALLRMGPHEETGKPYIYFDGNMIVEFTADTFPLAICKAAVAAVQEIERTK